MAIIGLLFFVFGFVTWLNGSLIPFLKVICDLNDFEALFVTFAFYISYTVMALPMAWVLGRTGYKNGMALGLAIMAAGALVFIPAALAANFTLFLLGLFMIGTGLTILQTASNPYVVLLGPEESAATRISIMGIINKTAGFVVPLIFAAVILSDLGDTSHLADMSADEIQGLAHRLITPYLLMAGVLVLLIGLIKFSSLPDIHADDHESEEAADFLGVFRFPQVVLGTLAIFAYVGVETIAGDTIGLFGSKIGFAKYAYLTSYTMAGMVIGYTIGVFAIPRLFSQQAALIGSAIAGTLSVLGIVLTSVDNSGISEALWGWSGIPTVPNPIFFVAMMGMSHALVWPAVWPLGLSGLGKYTAYGSALLIMGIAGGALLPLAFGHLSDVLGDMQAAYWLGAPCYLYILFYALKGHKLRSW
ncbi:MAG: glucose/galactose MFS transporter [Alphaproteobacteria bacterium]|nr:MAG: glucose/galactose MFS transporter [Alphaproteobacteria bacterium]